jgi:hypothetical protein
MVRVKVDLVLAAAIAAGDALTADGVGWTNAPGTRVLAFIQATLVAASDPLCPGAAELVTTVIRKAVAGAAVGPTPWRLYVVTWATPAGLNPARGSPNEDHPEQRTPRSPPRPYGPEEAGHSVKSLVVHRADPP